MDNRQTPDSMVMTAMIAGGVGFVAFLALMLVGGYTFSPALFLALVVAAAVFVFLLIAFHKKPPAPGDGAQTGGDRGSSGAAAKDSGGAAPAGGTSSGGAPAASAGVAASAPASASAAPAGEDHDKDDKAEGPDEGTKPKTLDAPRGGEADNLKEIKGVGPKMEKMLHGMGFYHFDQIAAWTADEAAWVDANLEGFKGRVSRDNWVEQAKILASGGDTEFSKRVDKGDVY